MTRRITARFGAYGLVAVVGVLGGLALGRPELVAVGTPALLILGFALLTTEPVAPRVAVSAARERVLEGEVVDLEITVSAQRPIPRLRVSIALPVGLAAMEGSTTVAVGEDGRSVEVSTPVSSNERRIVVPVECVRWGAYRRVGLRLQSTDFFGLFSFEMAASAIVPLKVFPAEKLLAQLLQPAETQLGLGELLSRRRGDGLEFAELRSYAVGDDRRRINWRASARGRGLWVNQHHPDRNSDVVLLIDSSRTSRATDEEVLDLAVSAAASLASGHLGRRDRVGLIVLGGRLVWMRPRMASAQRYQILDVLSESRRFRGTGANAALRVPYRAVPPQSLIVGVSPLLDPAVVAAFGDLRGRGFDLALVEIASEVLTPVPDSRAAQLARRIWLLERDRIRRRFAKAGVALARWDSEEPFDYAIGEVARLRRAMMRSGH